jgi:hypothetical protein
MNRALTAANLDVFNSFNLDLGVFFAMPMEHGTVSTGAGHAGPLLDFSASAGGVDHTTVNSLERSGSDRERDLCKTPG